MIIVGLKGGLGNQLFQYALGRRFSLDHGQLLKLNSSKYNKTTERNFELSNFCIKADIASGEDIHWFHHQISLRRLTNIFVPYYKRLIVYEQKSSYDPNILKANSENVYFIGYYQAEKYFSKIKKTLEKDLVLKGPPKKLFIKYEKMLRQTNSISLHIRRGDHLSKEHQESKVFQNINYYYKALNMLTSKLTKPVLYISSDGIDWVKENFKTTIPTVYLSSKEISASEEMVLMSKAKHNIIANSTLSWWGAWLNTNSSKIVVCPSEWFVGAKRNREYTRDLLPKKWLKL